MTAYRVISIGLNVRHSPTSAVNDNLYQPPLAQGEIVQQIGISPDGQWFQIYVRQGKVIRIGWVQAKYLMPTADRLAYLHLLVNDRARR